MNYFSRIITGLFGLLITMNGVGQHEEVRVIKPYTPTLSGAEKIQFLPNLDEEIEYEAPEFSYSIFRKRYDTEFRVTPIVAARMIQMSRSKLYRSHLKAGLGNYLTPYVELNINQLRSRNGTMGFNLSHHSMNGKVRLDNDAKVPGGFNENHAEFYGGRFLKNSQLNYRAGVDYDSYVHYGVDPDLDTAFVRKDLTHPYFTASGAVGLQSMHADTFHLNYEGILNYHYFTHDFNETEHGFVFDLEMDKSIRLFDIAGDVNVSYFGHAGGWDTVMPKHLVVSVNPRIQKYADQWKFVAGFNTSLDVRDGSPQFHLYPKALFEFNIVEEVIIPYFGVDGYLEPNNYRRVVDENPYIHPALSVKPASYRLVAFAGLKGCFSDALAWNIKGMYSIVEDQHFFINDTSSILKNQFNVVYDDFTLLNLHGEFAVRPNDSWKVFLKGNYYKYDMVREDYAWHKPNFDIVLQGRYNMKDKFFIDAGVGVIGPRYARDIDISGVVPVAENKKLPLTADVNLGVEYRYTKLLSFWVRINNLAAQRYYLYNQYPSYRFRFMAGFSYAL
ncbi:MAG: hypothetical protein JXR52_11205 [Bacteroidales bacterium]|nr:hypothetical protein [Bacteroidales bacterium]